MQTINFDDVAAKKQAAHLNNYAGLHWDNMYVTNGFTQLGYAGSGFQKGATSGQQVAYGGYANPATVSVKDGTFTLNSVEMAAGWAKSLAVDVTAFDAHGKVLHDQTVTLTDSAPQLETFDWEGISSVKFTPVSGVTDGAMGGQIGRHVVLDDFVVSDIQQHAAHAAATAHLVHSAADLG